REELHHCRLIKRRAVGRRDVVLRDTDEFRHSAVDMYAEDRDALAAIRLAPPAGDACAARQIRYQVDLLTHGDAAARPRLGNIAGQFVSEDSRVFQEWMGSFVDM